MRARLCGVIAASISSLPVSADAAAWIPDRTELIISSDQGVRGRFYNTANSLYFDAPVSRHFSIVGSGRYEISPSRPSSVRDVGEALLALKAGRPLVAGFVGAVQVGPTWRNDLDPDCSGFGAEARSLLGASRGPAFIDLQLGARFQSRSCLRAFYQASLGYRPARNWLALAQVFVDDDLQQGSNTNAQFSLVRTNKKGVGLQLGARIGFGDEPERTLVIGAWRKLGRERLRPVAAKNAQISE